MHNAKCPWTIIQYHFHIVQLKCIKHHFLIYTSYNTLILKSVLFIYWTETIETHCNGLTDQMTDRLNDWLTDRLIDIATCRAAIVAKNKHYMTLYNYFDIIQKLLELVVINRYVGITWESSTKPEFELIFLSFSTCVS